MPELEPGWLQRDVAKANARLKEWTMPDLTLADVERLTRLQEDLALALLNLQHVPPQMVKAANKRHSQASERVKEAAAKHLPALLALAREALERRPKEQPCRDCDDTGEFYGNLNIACGCPAGAKFTPRTEESPDA